MIVTARSDQTLRIVHQPDHAALAGALGQRWRRPAAVPAEVWPRFVDAVAHHDDGWHAAERAPALDEHGRPHTFKSVPTVEHVAIWRRGIDQLTARDTYAGLLVALHARWLYTHIDRGPGHDKAAAQALVAELDQQIDGRLATLRREGPAMRAALAPDVLDATRRLLGLLDALSLMLVGGLPAGGFPEPVPFGEQAARVSVTAKPGGLALAPWPFAGEAFDLAIPARLLPDRPYADRQAVAEAIAAAATQPLTFVLEPGS